MVEPTWTYRDIHLGRQPSLSITIALLQCFGVIKRFEISFIHRPLRGTRLAFFVAYPAQSRHCTTENTRLGAVFPNDVPCLLVVVILFRNDGANVADTTIPTCAAVGTVEPELEQRTVVAHKFLNLFVIDVHIALITVFRLVAVPRREIQAKLQSVLLASLS